MINLLDEIHSEGGSVVTSNDNISTRMSSETVITVNHHLSIFDPINDNVSRINLACNRIDKLYVIKRTGLPDQSQS